MRLVGYLERNKNAYYLFTVTSLAANIYVLL